MFSHNMLNGLYDMNWMSRVSFFFLFISLIIYIYIFLKFWYVCQCDSCVCQMLMHFNNNPKKRCRKSDYEILTLKLCEWNKAVQSFRFKLIIIFTLSLTADWGSNIIFLLFVPIPNYASNSKRINTLYYQCTLDITVKKI